jgi:hypothetical protein
MAVTTSRYSVRIRDFSMVMLTLCRLPSASLARTKLASHLCAHAKLIVLKPRYSSYTLVQDAESHVVAPRAVQSLSKRQFCGSSSSAIFGTVC